MFEYKIEFATVLVQRVFLLRSWLSNLNPARVVSTATNQLICQSRVGMSSSFFPFAIRSFCSENFIYLLSLFLQLFSEINFSCGYY